MSTLPPQTPSSPFPKNSKKPKPKPTSPILTSLTAWISTLPPELLSTITSSLPTTTTGLLSSAPRRWVVYPPMVLLPSGSFSSNIWRELLFSSGIGDGVRDELWMRILEGIGKVEGKGKLTHLAVNCGIPLHNTSLHFPSQSQSHPGNEPTKTRLEKEEENLLRTPSGLQTLYGDFGPSLPPSQPPTEADFEKAFWVSTKQNGIVQVWAPRYTMFSRGNVKEKARLLDFHTHTATKTKSGTHEDGERMGRRRRENEELKNDVAVDLYAGIGYFVFSYVGMGIGRVVGWEINPWSVEGLRRGAGENGWGVKVVEASEEVGMLGDERIVIFEEDNGKAFERLKGLEEWDGNRAKHVNCGLLPTSEGSWEMALGILRGKGWIHVHENVGVNDVETRKGEIEEKFRAWLKEKKDEREVVVEHVEFVKTFAPGVWHCVFDIYITT